MGVVTEVLEKVVGINWRTLAVPFVAFCNFFSVLLTKQYFFLEKRNIEICISVFGMWFCKQNISYFGWSMIFFFFAFSINTYVPFLHFACAGLVMTKGYLVFNIM